MFKLLTTLKSEPNDEFAQEIIHHPTLRNVELKYYFLDMECYAYIANLFSIDPANLPVGTRYQEELIDNELYKTAMTKHIDCSPINLWVSMAYSYLTSCRNAVPWLLSSLYMGERTGIFSLH